MFQQEKTNGDSRMKNANARKGAAVVAIVLGMSLMACSDGGSSSSSGGKQGWSLTLKYSENGSTDSRYSLVSKHWWPWGGTYAKTECVKDSRTGLVWEGKTASGLRAGSNRYTNYDSTSSKQKLKYSSYINPTQTVRASFQQQYVWNGDSYINPTQAVHGTFLRQYVWGDITLIPINPTQTEIDASDNSIGYVKAINASALCGFTDWRLPTQDELAGIVDKNQNPTIDSVWFPNTQSWSYWTSSPVAHDSIFALLVDFDAAVNFGNYDGGDRNYDYAVRLVRASQ